MKLTVQLFAMILALFYSTTATAAVNPYDVMEITPAEGVVTSLQHFTITFADLPVVVSPNAVPTLEKGGGGTIEGTMCADADGTTVLVDFEECITEPGHYFLNLPENSLTVNGQRLLPLTLRFEISGTMETFYDQITIDPAEGEVESLQNFVISFPEFIGEIEYGMQATLTNNTTGATWQTDMYDVRYNVLIYFPEEVTEPGDYTLTIPAGAVVFYTFDEQVHELNFHYTIGGGAELVMGDVDGNGIVGIADVTALIDIILSGSDGPEVGDVDHDGILGIADVTGIIDMILGGSN